jgi:hypothetical protein
VARPLRIDGAAIDNFKISGPALVAFEGAIEALEFLPPPSTPDASREAALMLMHAETQETKKYLVDSRLVDRGTEGFTVEARMGGRLTLTFRCPYEVAGIGRAEWSCEDLTGGRISDVLDIADFMIELPRSAQLDMVVGKSSLFRADLDQDASLAEEGLDRIRDLADDLQCIEYATRARFRYPDEITVMERIKVRNLRLMLEGNVVAHPIASKFSGLLGGGDRNAVENILTREPYQVMTVLDEPEHWTILGNVVRVPQIMMIGVVSMRPDDIAEVEAAFERGTAKGHKISLHARPGDRLRMYMPYRVLEGTPLDIPPWDIPRIPQKGILGPITPS